MDEILVRMMEHVREQGDERKGRSLCFGIILRRFSLGNISILFILELRKYFEMIG